MKKLKVSFTTIPNDAILDTRLDTYEFRVLCYLCEIAGVPKEKVFPHNLRHLFAKTYYSLQKDIVRLADILGHSSINTTRVYTIEDGDTHRKQIESMGLVCMRT